VINLKELTELLNESERRIGSLNSVIFVFLHSRNLDLSIMAGKQGTHATSGYYQ
jgi:hypothetical protein